MSLQVVRFDKRKYQAVATKQDFRNRIDFEDASRTTKGARYTNMRYGGVCGIIPVVSKVTIPLLSMIYL